MFTQSIGLIETIGLASAVVAADVAVKSANVELIGYELTKGSGLVTVKIAGDVGSVKAGIDAAVSAVNDIGTVYSYKVIPRLGENVEKIIYTNETVGISKNKTVTSEKGIKKNEEPIKMTRVQKGRTTKNKSNNTSKDINKVESNEQSTPKATIAEVKKIEKKEIPKQLTEIPAKNIQVNKK